MAVILVDDVLQPKRKLDINFQRTYTRTFRVVTDSIETRSIEVTNSIPVALGDAYVCGNESDPGSFCTEIATDPTDDDGKGWTVTANYTPLNPNEITAPDPINWPIEIDWDADQFETIVDNDIFGNPILNTAKDYFDPPVKKDDSRPVLNIVQNVLEFDALQAYLYRDAVNSDTFLDIEPGYLKMRPIKARRLFHGDIGFYWQRTIQIHINPDGWTRKILNEGMRQLEGNTHKHIFMKGVPVTNPVLLDGDGIALKPSGDPITLEFKIYPELPYAALGIF